jgi:hypothetical protein
MLVIESEARSSLMVWLGGNNCDLFELGAKRRYRRDDYDVPYRAIFGFVGTYGAICIRRHVRLDCLVVQFC